MNYIIRRDYAQQDDTRLTDVTPKPEKTEKTTAKATGGKAKAPAKSKARQ